MTEPTDNRTPDRPSDRTPDQLAARERLVQAVLRLLAAERAEPHAHFDDDLDYARDELDEAAHQLSGHLRAENPEGP